MTTDYISPDFASAALITIDTQCDVLDGQPLEIAGTSAALPRMRLLLDAFREAGAPIVHVVRLYVRDGSNADLCRRAAIEQGAVILAPGTPGSQLAPDLAPGPENQLDHELLLAGGVQSLGEREVAIYKPRWGAFFDTPLERHLNEMDCSTLVFCGCNFPNCPRTSVYEASERDFRVVVVRDALSGLYGRGERELENIGVELLDAEQAVVSLASVGASA
ncbi:MAG TPA: isochorismatase family cysteine hydrolase [Solirubrobacteraceae bacterium]|nr:isochorismatase family cysteine hydrolase [Solirubrobacteraceae bacterium]